MRGTVAKALRRQARAETEGKPAKAYLSKQHVKRREIKTEVEVDDADKGKKGIFSKAINGVRKLFRTERQVIRVTSEQIRVDPASTRGRYLELKRARKA